ncbi:ribonuclease H-like domain-containing protein [Tanacetum coccineum]|uniref:Ribonuclease H-like domain-containing protein n=1 Tax=Tanacetum coccineum TaxID=301880 RepID=A0ABQ4ZK83_9ASTR
MGLSSTRIENEIVITMLVSKVASSSIGNSMNNYLNDFQFGVGVPGGCEAVLHSVNSLVESKGNEVGLSMPLVDFKNAFNLVDMSVVLEETRVRCPSIAPWDPLGPLLFALALHPLVHTINQLCGLTLHAWYLDDNTIVGDTLMVAKALDIIKAKGPTRGLFLNVDKTKLFWPVEDLRSRVEGVFPLNISRPLNSVKLLGGSVSLDECFCWDLALKRVSKTISLMEAIHKLHDPQCELLLLHNCTVQFDQALRASLEKVVTASGPGFDDWQWRLATLPIKLGGLGILSAGDIIRYVVPTGKDNFIVSVGRPNMVPASRTIDEYEVRTMKMEYWITNNDMNIWKVIQNGNNLKRTGRDRDGRVIILPPTTADEHIAVQRESKARTTLLQSIPDDHVADFHYMDDARDIWNAVKARFGGNAESKKIRKSMLKQEFSEFRISESEGLHKGYDRMQKILSQLNQLKAKPDDEDINLKFLRGLPSSWSQVALTLKTKGGLELLSFDDLYYKLKTLEVDIKGYSTFSSSQSAGPSHSAFVSTTSASKKMSYADSPSYSSSTYTAPSNSKTGSHRSGNVIEDVLQSFVADTEPEQQLAYEDFEQIEKMDLEEMDLKWQMAMLSVRVHKFEQKAGRKIDFDKKESARFNKKKVRCYKCLQRGHFARECRAKGGNDKQRYSSFKIQEIGKKEEDSKALITVDTLVDWTEHDGQSDGVIAPKEFGMIAGCDTEDAIEEGAAKIYNLITGADTKEASTAGDAGEFALMGVTSERVYTASNPEFVLLRIVLCTAHGYYYYCSLSLSTARFGFMGEFEMSDLENFLFLRITVQHKDLVEFYQQDKYVARDPEERLIGSVLAQGIKSLPTTSKFGSSEKKIFKKLISWQCKKQTNVATSSTKAEYVDAANCCGQVVLFDERVHSGSLVFTLVLQSFATGSFIFPTGRTLPTGNVNFPLVDFSLCLRYALTNDPIIFDSLVKQFWSTATLRSPELGPPAILATIDETPYTITEDSLNFEGQPMQLLAAMLPQDQEGEGAGPQDHLSTPPRQQTSDPFTSTNVEDEPLGGSFHASPPRSTQAPPAGHTSGGVEDLITLTALSSVVSTFVQKVNSLETELKAHKKLFKDVVAKLVKKVKAIEYGDFTPAHSTSPSRDLFKKRKGVAKPSSPVSERTKKQLADERLSEIEAARLEALERERSEKEKAEIARQDAIYAKQLEQEVEMSASQRETRQAEVLSSANHYSNADWIDIMAQVHASVGLSSELLGADVNDDNFAERMVALINQRKRAFAEQTAKEKKDKPMTPT